MTAGVIAIALLAAAAVLVPRERLRAAAALAALVLTPVLLVVHIWDTPQLEPLRDRPLVSAVGAVLALAALGTVAWAFRRWPRALPIAAIAAVPFRLPIESGGDTVNLLLPLYFVIGAGVLAWAIPVLREDVEEEDNRAPALVAWALMGLVVLYAIQSAYSLDFDRALEQVVFFYVPFALLFVLLARVDWDAQLLRTAVGVLAGLALLFAAIGFFEYATREVLFNPKVIRTNEFASYFRVNSLFFDPNIYGRFLDVTMIALTAVLIWSARRRDVLVAGAGLAILWAALLTTLSQSSFAALLAGLAVLAALRWSVRWTIALLAGVAVAGVAVVLVASGPLGLDFADPDRLNDATSGRVELLEGGAELTAEKPLAGWGSASFSDAFQEEDKGSASQAVSASHTIPLTVAAEQGLLGLIVYLALVLAALWALLRGARGSGPFGIRPHNDGPASRRPAGSPARAAVGAAFVALLVHTMLYAAFLEDPMTWALLGVGAGLAATQRVRAEAAEREARRTRTAVPA